MQPTGERHGYRPAGSNRWAGLGATALIYAVVLAGFFVTISTTHIKPSPPSTLTVIDIRPPASPPEAPPEEREAPKPVEKKQTPPDPASIKPIEPMVTPRVMVPIPVALPRPAAPASREAETAAPKTAPAPPTPQIASEDLDTWEGRVLAKLHKHRRYPRMAMARRQQGVPYIRFVMDREGKVLTVELERSSGFSDLDREAIALPKRAQPLPRPPIDKSGDTLELVVPVEFFIR